MSNVYPLTTSLPVEAGIRRVVTLSSRDNGSLMVAEVPTAMLYISVSCLIEPQAGDRVCVVIDEHVWWITDVLACADETRPLTLRSAHSALSIEADNLSLHARQTLTIKSPTLTLMGQSSRWLADKMHQIAGHLHQRCRNAERLVSETDTVEAEHIQHQATASYRVDSELTAVNGRSVLKIDGGQVHVG